MILTRPEPASRSAIPHTDDEAVRPDRCRRILMTLDAVGGVWRYSMELARALKPLGIDTLFAGFGPGPSPEQECEAMGIGDLVWTSQPLDWMAKDERALDIIGPALEELADAYDIDILHCNLPSQAARLGGGRPVVAVSHSCVVTWWEAMRGTPLPEEWEWQRHQNAQGFARADAIIAPSASHAELVQLCYGSVAKLAVVRNGIAGRLDGAAKDEVVFAAGRWWDEGKNARVLDAAAAKTKWPVKMAGDMDGPGGQVVELRHAEAMGQMAHGKLLEQVKRSAILVSPSLYEPFGLAALEGARSGAALILADIPTYRELWSQAALFFDPCDHEGLAAAINLLAEDPELRGEMARRALARSWHYTPDSQAGAMSDVYRALVPALAPSQGRNA